MITSILALLGLIFITLRLTKTIKWSWFWILSPFILIIIGWLFVVGMFGLMLAGGV